MKVFEYSRIFLLVLVFFIIIDGLVIGFFLSDFYERELTEVARLENGMIKPFWPGIAIVYILMSVSLTYIIIHSEESSEALVFLKGAGFGIVIYGIYNLANYSLLRAWNADLLMIDLIWGTVLCGTVSVCTFTINKLMK